MSAERLAAAGLRVKLLEWEGDPRWPNTSWARGVCGEYQISEEDEGLWCLRLAESCAYYQRLDDAKAGAQLDYDTRILAALEDAP